MTTLVGTVVLYTGSGSFLLHALIMGVVATVWWIAFFRFRLLGALCALCTGNLLEDMPMISDLSAWYAPPCILTLLLLAGLGILSFRAALAPRPWQNPLREEATA